MGGDSSSLKSSRQDGEGGAKAVEEKEIAEGEREGESLVVRLSCNIFIPFDAVDASAPSREAAATHKNNDNI